MAILDRSQAWKQRPLQVLHSTTRLWLVRLRAVGGMELASMTQASVRIEPSDSIPRRTSVPSRCLALDSTDSDPSCKVADSCLPASALQCTVHCVARWAAALLAVHAFAQSRHNLEGSALHLADSHHHTAQVQHIRHCPRCSTSPRPRRALRRRAYRQATAAHLRIGQPLALLHSTWQPTRSYLRAMMLVMQRLG